ncbi:MAG TPA: hypothetical protein VF384_11280 [Planctomycetota bacterium]
MSPTHLRCWFPALTLLLLCSCQSGPDQRTPRTADRSDRNESHLARSGTDAELYWSPKQNLLFSEYKTLQELHSQLEKRHDRLLAENQNLKAQLEREGSNLHKERSMRAQAEAETTLQQQRGRELEARILGLSIEKAKLEQQILQARIDALRQQLPQDAPAAAEPAPAPPRDR